MTQATPKAIRLPTNPKLSGNEWMYIRARLNIARVRQLRTGLYVTFCTIRNCRWCDTTRTLDEMDDLYNRHLLEKHP